MTETAKATKDISNVIKNAPKKKSIFKKLLPERLLTRTLTILITPVILVQLVIGIVFWNRHWSETTTSLARNIASNVSALIYIAEHDSLLDTKTTTLSKTQKAPEQTLSTQFASFVDLQAYAEENFDYSISRDDQSEPLPVYKKKSVSWRDGLTAKFLRKALESIVKKPFTFKIEDNDINIHVKTDQANYSFSLHKRKLIPSATSLMIWWQVGAPLFFILIAALFMRNQVRPLLNLSNVVDEFGKGRDVSSFQPSGALEVRRVGYAFNKMRERIHKSIKHRTEMLAGISHDLKTPLTRMQLELALQPDSESKTALLEDVSEMKTMVEEYLGFAKGEGAEASKSVNASDFLRALFTKFPQDAISIQDLSDLKTIHMKVRPYALKRAFGNIITNAIRYAGHIWFHAEKKDSNLVFTFEDNGPGIPESERGPVFRPFYRLDSSRNTQTGGYGLGLSICRDIISSHGGTIVLDDSKTHGGLKVRVTIPL